uniref:Keratocan n=1 Tax=Sinocyclocheilus anshuiensis TaxID=1608454 RepID=A0A671MU93_9TELE
MTVFVSSLFLSFFRLNLTMEWLMVAFVALLLAGQVSSEEIPYEHLMSQIQACPKECRCPPSFPNAVYCDNKGLKHIPVIPPYTWYLWINLNRNKITSEGLEADALKAMSNLVHLYMEDNLLSSIPSSLPAKLEQLRLSRNRISNIPPGVFSGMDHLTLLDLQGNKLQDDAVTEVSLKGLNNLIQINLAKNQLNTMPLGLPPTTTQIFLDSNNIEKIPAEYFKGLPKVVSLRLNRNKLANGGIPKNVFNLSSILDLQLSHNQLTEIPVISSGLEHLHLDHNKIKSVNSSDICPPDALDDYPDEKSPRLRYLRLDGNEIKPPIPRELMMCFRLLRVIVI